ncbi:MAG: sigma-70 family RNA polymerase sigma factor [Cyanobacteria bacterium]|nr:sigma-70 family RNA polymerase sigma factor [Cyanobacteriota bacterium]
MARENSNDHIFTPELDQMLAQYAASDPGTRSRDRLREHLVEAVMPYVKKIAGGLARRSSDPVEDITQVGSIGLMKALDKYNPNAGTSFKTYATYLITGEIRHYLRDKSSMIKAPRQMYELYYRVNQIIQRLSDELGRMPTDLEIAEELQCPVNKVTQAQEIDRRRQPISLDQFATQEGSSETVYIERLVDDRYYQFLLNQEDKITIDNVLAKLKEEYRTVIVMTYFEDLSQTEIAQKLGISQMQVSRRLRKALDLMSQALSKSESNQGQSTERSRT